MVAVLMLVVTAGLAADVDAGRLRMIPERLKEFAARGTAPGFVTLVAQHGKIVHFEAVGHTDFDQKKPMAKEAIFQLHSMTKPVVCLAVMMLAEQGLLNLTDPVERHMPEFRGLRVLEGGALVKPARLVTVRDLMTHTSGMMLDPPASIGELHDELHLSLEKVVLVESQQPLLFQPGTRWSYSNTGIAALGRLIEVKSGMAFERFLEERIFRPLKMADTMIYPPKEKWNRMPTAYYLLNGKTVPHTFTPLGEGKMKFREAAKYPLPEGGLYSTAADLARLYQMLLNGGVLEGARIVSKASIEVMTRNHTGALATSEPGAGWGLGWFVRPNGVYGHGGRFGTFAMIDPANDLFGIFLIHRQGGSDERQAFESILRGALGN